MEFSQTRKPEHDTTEKYFFHFVSSSKGLSLGRKIGRNQKKWGLSSHELRGEGAKGVVI